MADLKAMSDEEFNLEPCECPMRPPREILADLGFVAKAADGLEGSQLRGCLWELIYALAARRFYFYRTDHLSDWELYVWLVEDWMEEPIGDVPPESGWNCHTSPEISPDGKYAPELVWLRYYATPADRDEVAWTDGDESLPAHVDPPHDRDRFLPDPFPPPPVEIDYGAMMDEKDDPLGLKEVDREIARSRFEEADESELFDENWEHPAETLKQAGYTPMPPAEVTPETQSAVLWELLHELAIRGFYVLSTNHLSDEEIYADLWRHGIRDAAILPGKTKTAAWFHDIIGSGSEEDIDLWLRFHADDKARADWLSQFPETTLPPREKADGNRDWRLPKAPM